MTSASPVWITGVGTCTPLGTSYPEFAANLLAGRSAIRRVRGFDVEQHPSQIAGQVFDIPCPAGDDPLTFAALDRQEQLVRWCCAAALQDAGLWERRHELRIGLVLGVGAEWLLLWERQGHAGWHADWQPEPGELSLIERTCRHYHLTGPRSTVSAACASGNVALARARDWLRLGWADVCLAGACDVAVSPMVLAAFGNLRALSRRNDAPAAASRPFDRDRDGFVLSEGGALYVLEPAGGARARGARVYAELAGSGAASDAYHMVIPSPDPAPAASAMRQALADAGVGPEAVEYVNAHATSTPVGDAAEARVLATVLGDEVRRVPVSSTKSMTGHLLTAAAAVEALACITAMHHGAIPPTINLDSPDPECPLCHVANEARQQSVRVAVSNSFGFGGSNTCVVFRAA